MSSPLKPVHVAREELRAIRIVIIVMSSILFAAFTFGVICTFELRSIVEPAMSNSLFKQVDFESTVVTSWIFTGIFAILACVIAFAAINALVRMTPEGTES